MTRQPIGLHGVTHLPDGQDPIPGLGALETTDGLVDVNPTSQLFIGAGLTLSNPSAGEAAISLAFTPSTEFVGGSVTITASGSAKVSFAHDSGAALMDFTTATDPVPIVDGFYAFTGTVRQDTPFTSQAVSPAFFNYLTSPTTTTSWASVFKTSAGEIGFLPWAGTVPLLASTGSWSVLVGNNDSVSHGYTAAGTIVRVG